MKNQKQIIILVIVLIAAALVWALFFRGGAQVTPPTDIQPVAEDTGKFVPKLNNTLETSVTVVNPNEAPAQPN